MKQYQKLTKEEIKEIKRWLGFSKKKEHCPLDRLGVYEEEYSEEEGTLRYANFKCLDVSTCNLLFSRFKGFKKNATRNFKCPCFQLSMDKVIKKAKEIVLQFEKGEK